MSTRRHKILIIEDETMLSDVYSMVLTRNDFDVEVACNGIEALEKLPVFQPDLLLLDLFMPKMDGVTFLETLPAADKTGRTIIVYSNLFDSDTDDKVRSLGADDVILKSSLDPGQLVALIKSYCKN